MTWIKLRPIIAATLTLAMVSALAGASVLGQGSAQQPPATTPGQTPPPENPAARSELRVRQLATRKAKIVLNIASSKRELAELAVVEL